MGTTKIVAQSPSWDDEDEVPEGYTKLLSFDADVYRFCIWYANDSQKVRRIAMEMGGIRDLVHEAYMSMRKIKPHVLRRVKWTTAAANSIRWTAMAFISRKRRGIFTMRQIEQHVPSGMMPALFPDEYTDDHEVAEGLDDALHDVLDLLPYRERAIIEMRYGLGDGFAYKLGDVAYVFGVTRERVRQLESRAMHRLCVKATSVQMQKLVQFVDDETKSDN